MAALAASVSAAQLAQFVSLVASPAGMGVSAPLRYMLAPHHLEHLEVTSGAYCAYENDLTSGDNRITLTGPPARKVTEGQPEGGVTDGLIRQKSGHDGSRRGA